MHLCPVRGRKRWLGGCLQQVALERLHFHQRIQLSVYISDNESVALSRHALEQSVPFTPTLPSRIYLDIFSEELYGKMQTSARSGLESANSIKENLYDVRLSANADRRGFLFQFHLTGQWQRRHGSSSIFHKPNSVTSRLRSPHNH